VTAVVTDKIDDLPFNFGRDNIRQSVLNLPEKLRTVMLFTLDAIHSLHDLLLVNL
jgi:hypothetical protein